MLMGVVKRNYRVDAPHPAGATVLLGDGIINCLLAVDAWVGKAINKYCFIIESSKKTKKDIEH